MGAPTDTKAYKLGELWLDATGVLWHCTAAGSPGLWAEVGLEVAAAKVAAHEVAANPHPQYLKVTDLEFDFIQLSPSTVWTLDHGLNRHPAVVVRDMAGNTIEPSIAYTSLNQIVLTFAVPTTGYVTLAG